MANWFDNVPVPMDANGIVVPLDTRELVYMGETREVYCFIYSIGRGSWNVGFKGSFGAVLNACTMPDSWERLEADVERLADCYDVCDYFKGTDRKAYNCDREDGFCCDLCVARDILRRAKALSCLRGRKDMPKAMVSQPMVGEMDEQQIASTRERATAKLEAMGYEVVDTLFTEEAVDGRGVVQVPLWFLAKSLESMSLCHAVYFCRGWENALGCRIERDAAVAYGLEVLYED